MTLDVPPRVAPAGPSRAARWLRRYGPAEIAAVLGAVAGAGLAAWWWRDGAATAFGGSIGEALAFYGFLVARDVRANRVGVPAIVRGLVLEFGPAEFVDTAAVRPLAMYLGQFALGSPLGGVIAGKLGADLVFYGLAILSVEARRAWARGARVAGAAHVDAARTDPARAGVSRAGVAGSDVARRDAGWASAAFLCRGFDPSMGRGSWRP